METLKISLDKFISSHNRSFRPELNYSVDYGLSIHYFLLLIYYFLQFYILNL